MTNERNLANGEGNDLGQIVYGNPNAGRLIDDYRNSYSKYKKLSANIENLLSQILADEGIHATFEHRTKEPSSLQEKLARKHQYASLGDIPDLAGVRIIVRYLSDIEKVAALINSEFQVAEYATHTFESPESFGYASHHMIVSLNTARLALREWQVLTGLRCEIQVRTILQHAWASISHSLDYKTQEDVPQSIRRNLFKVAALLESGDDMFERYRASVEVLRTEYAETSAWENLPVDMDSLSAHWSKLRHDFIEASIVAAEFQYSSMRTPDEVTSGVVRGCSFYRIETLGQLNQFIETQDFGMKVTALAEVSAVVIKGRDSITSTAALLVALIFMPDSTKEIRDYIMDIKSSPGFLSSADIPGQKIN